MSTQMQEERRWLLRQDEQRENLWNHLLRIDDAHRENLNDCLQEAIDAAHAGNWPYMRQAFGRYCETEHTRLGSLARLMEEEQIVVQGNKGGNIERERDLFQQIFGLCRTFMLSAQEKERHIKAEPPITPQDKHDQAYFMHNLRTNYGYCLEVLSFLVNMHKKAEVLS